MSAYLDQLIADPTSFHDAPYAQAFTLSRDDARRRGDDCIVCAGAPEAHDRALGFLAELSM